MTPTEHMGREAVVAQLCEITGQRTHDSLMDYLQIECCGLVSDECAFIDDVPDSDLSRALTSLQRNEMERQGQGYLFA